MLKFKVFGNIPVVITHYFWLMALFIAWVNASTLLEGVLWVGVVLLSVLIHECGHALTARVFGQDSKIELVALGGVTIRSGRRLKSWQEFVIVLNGPLAGLLLSGFAWFGASYFTSLKANSVALFLLSITFYINLFWTIINLVPVQPLDGGKLLNIAMEGFFGVRGNKIALMISVILGAALTIYFFIIHEFIAGSLFFMMTYEGYRAWKASLVLTSIDHSEEFQQLLKEADEDIANGNRDQALEKIQHVRQSTKAGALYLVAVEQEAHILVSKGESQAAYDLLQPLKDKLDLPSLRLLHLLAFKQDKWQEVAELGDKVYRFYPKGSTALLNALSHAQLNHPRETVGWLECLDKSKSVNIPELVVRSEFDAIRQDFLFQSFLHQLATSKK